MKNKILTIGPITKDIIKTPTQTYIQTGGASYYQMWTLYQLKKEATAIITIGICDVEKINDFPEKNNIKPVTSKDKRTEVLHDSDIKTKFDFAFFVDNEAIEIKKTNQTAEFNSAIISKLVNDFVFAGDITEKEFKRLMEKEMKEAKKRKEKAEAGIRKTIDAFFQEFDKKKKKINLLIK